jgi:DNA polymerase-3 subunit delta
MTIGGYPPHSTTLRFTKPRRKLPTPLSIFATQSHYIRHLMLIESLSALLRATELPRVIFLFGEEEFMVEEAAAAIADRMREEGTAPVDIEVLDGEELSIEQIVRRAEAFPMASAQRLITVRRFDRTAFGRKHSAEHALWLQYVASPSTATVLVLMATDGRIVSEELKGIAAALANPKQRSKAEAKLAKLRFPYNALLSHAAWLEMPRLPERRIPEWIIERFKRHGYDCTLEAAEYLLVQTGPSLRDLANEIAKTILYAGPQRRITREHVIAVAGASRTYNIFELQKALGQKDRARALLILHYMVRTERQDLLIVTMLTRYFLILWRLSELRATTPNHSELGRAVGVSPFFVPEYIAALDQYTPAEIERALDALHTADVQLKTTSLDTLTVLEHTLVAITT